MKIVVTSSGRDMDSPVDYRFGRCPYFLIVDTDDMSFEVIPNEAANEFGGAGIKAAQNIIKLGAEALITGNIGPNAYQVLSSAGIRIFAGPEGTVRDAIESFKNNELHEIKAPTSPSHSGRRLGGIK
ncbi:MAG TPA: dinitrogenase iron-molybdenum cofactor biosynthesis protein [Thermoplasmatales archaeon]|nr:dinitrogenase iron-molybdenum cofactor biosynthesis protein [Thermoplasmatales archaeon]